MTQQSNQDSLVLYNVIYIQLRLLVVFLLVLSLHRHFFTKYSSYSHLVSVSSCGLAPIVLWCSVQSLSRRRRTLGPCALPGWQTSDSQCRDDHPQQMSVTVCGPTHQQEDQTWWSQGDQPCQQLFHGCESPRLV